MSRALRMRARYTVIDTNAARVVIRDVGHDQGVPSITNDAEAVVDHVVAAGLLTDGLGKDAEPRRLFYVDSEGDRSELRVTLGRFAGFVPG